MDRTLSSPHIRLRALLWILSLTLLISGSALIAHTLYQTIREERKGSAAYQIGAIIQPKERLPADEIAALLGLSSDYPINLYAFDLQKGKQALASSPRIRAAKIKRAPPDALYIDLTLRAPIALIAPGMALDSEGVIFPYPEPFEGPSIRLGGGGAKEALDILQTLPNLAWIDVTRIDHTCYGLREIVVGMQGGSLLRLPIQGYQEALERYGKLKNIVEEPAIIDLRLPKLAYIKRKDP